METKQNSKVKIFVGYAKPNTLFKTNVFQPILTSSIDWDEKDLIRDNTGINIAEKNKNYAELTGHYWVWKNFLPETDAEYIGFGHYRRFLDYGFTKMPNVPFKPVKAQEFDEIFKNYTEENILNCIGDYDIVLPEKFRFENEILKQYLEYHPPKDLMLALDIIKEIYPEYFLSAVKFISSKEMYACLNFIMKKELLADYMEWMFNFLSVLEERAEWAKYSEYMDIRMPAFLAERFFNVWLMHKIESQKIKILNTTSIIITGNDYGKISYENYIKSYYDAAESNLYKSKM